GVDFWRNICYFCTVKQITLITNTIMNFKVIFLAFVLFFMVILFSFQMVGRMFRLILGMRMEDAKQTKHALPQQLATS
ncbi:MAG: hypothetical protein AAF570_09225, partial [Bacteroidota bacterium]